MTKGGHATDKKKWAPIKINENAKKKRKEKQLQKQEANCSERRAQQEARHQAGKKKERSPKLYIKRRGHKGSKRRAHEKRNWHQDE